VFCAEGDWRRAEVEVTQAGNAAHLVVSGQGDLEAAAAQASRFLALDVNGRGWPEVGRRDPVIAGAQARLPGLRPCGFHSPYEAAAWSVLSQRLRISQAARLRAELIARHGEGGAFPRRKPCARWIAIFPAVRVSTCGRSPRPRWTGYWTARRCAPSTQPWRSSACSRLRGSARSPRSWSWSAARTLPTRCPATNAGWTPRSPEQYGPGCTPAEVAEAWRPYRTWATVHLRALREQRTGEIAGR
jgi:DNA-3-methyladenine glycosylase II